MRPTAGGAPAYPIPPRATVVDALHGVDVDDPYRPLEDVDAPATRAWVMEQNALTQSYLSQVPSRPDIRRRVAEMWDYQKHGAPFERGGRWFQFRNSGLQAQSVLYVGESRSATERALIDPNTMSEDGTVALSGLALSVDGRLVAYSTSAAGSDWQTWHVRQVDSGADLVDEIEWSKFSGAAWNGDSSGFFYGAPARPAAGQELTESTAALQVFFHAIGTHQAEDTTVFAVPDEPEWIPGAATTDDGRHLVITVTRGTAPETRVLVGPSDRAASSGLVPLDPADRTGNGFSARDEMVEMDPQGVWLVLTDRGAERGRLIRARPGEDPTQWEELIPAGDDTLSQVRLVGGHLVCHYLRGAYSVLKIHDLTGAQVREIPLPGYVSVVELTGRPGSTLLHFQVVSYTQPGAVWSHDVVTGETDLLFETDASFDGSRYLTEQVWAPSLDGTPIPMLLTRAKDVRPAGETRVLLYGYGGFSVPLTPWFSVTFAAWLERGGMVAVANLRGGSEFGRAWHDAGRLERKQNVFDDFCGCARWLVSSGWSSPERIAINGGSNGGLLVGACLTQHPELFGAAIPEVGVMDMLRFHLWTIGWAWKSDYGDPDDPEQFAWLLAYSPLHHIESRCYPTTLVMTGDHDDRVVPAHSFKFAATLQAAQSCGGNPILLRVAESAGHGAGKPTAKLIDEAADRVAFLDSTLSPDPISPR